MESVKYPIQRRQELPRKLTFLHRLDIRLPWLKLLVVCFIGIIAILDLCNLTISRGGDTLSAIKIAPMLKHPRATERVITGKKLVALTFDDGPLDSTTPRLLDILAEKDVPATFFMLGKMARLYPDLVKRVEHEHHVVASHTMYHQNLVHLTAPAVQSDIDEAKSVFKSILGHSPIYIRPPYGNINDNVHNAINKPIILWSVDTEDWRSKDVNSIVATTMSEVHDGAIILMHDIYPTSVDAVPVLIDTLRQEGYEFATIAELAATRQIALLPSAVYYNFLP